MKFLTKIIGAVAPIVKAAKANPVLVASAVAIGKQVVKAVKTEAQKPKA